MNIENKNDLSELFQKRREELGISQRELVRRSKVAPATISRLESDRKDYQNLRLDTILALLNAMGLEMIVQRKNDRDCKTAPF